jgi:hypothetical protein
METTTPPPNPAAGAPLVEYVRSQRQNAAYMLIGLGVLLLALTVFLGFKAFRASATPEKPADKPLAENPFDPERLDQTKPPGEGTAQRTQYIFGWVGTLLGCAAATGCGIWLLAGVPAIGAEKQRAEARILLLAAGGLLGALLIIFGMAYFYLWSDSLGKWIDRRELKEARWVLIPLLMILAGAGLVFAAIQPARAEERNNSSVRRLVYGSNFGLTALLLLVAMVVVNVLIAREIPNTLDTTSTGIYSISNNTKALLARLDQPVKAYAIGTEGPRRELNSIRQLLTAFQENSDGKFTVKFLSRVARSDQSEVSGLRSKYPQLDLALEQRNVAAVVLLSTGEDEKRHKVIPNTEFVNEQREFTGEARLFKEVAFLADSQTKPVVYFTQGRGELDITGNPDASPARSASRLKDYLEKNYIDIRPLNLPSEKPEIPADAAMVVIAEPLIPFPEAVVAALRKYMTDPNKKGKLLFLAGSAAGPDQKMVKTGLEPLLEELNVHLDDHFVYNLPIGENRSLFNVLVLFSRAAEQNPILQEIGKVSGQLDFRFPRVVEARSTNPTLTATPLLYMIGRTWLEEQKPSDPYAAIREIIQSDAIRKQKQYSESPRPAAVIVSEGAIARAVVIGNSFLVSDENARQFNGNPLTFDLFGLSVDWLRDKQTSAAIADIEAKKYSEYTFPAPSSVDYTRLVWLPLGLALLTVVGLGAGVWVIRRR